MKLSVLCPVRPNSEWVARFIPAFFTSIRSTEVELRMMVSDKGVWNKPVFEFYKNRVTFTTESSVKGRYGLHDYYNELVKGTNSDWVMLVCEDFDFVYPGWDKYILDDVQRLGLHPHQVCAYLPKMVGSIGAVCHVLSRGYINAVNGVISGHYSVDSWVNKVLEVLPASRVCASQEILLDDYTHTKSMRGVSQMGSGSTDFLGNEEVQKGITHQRGLVQ